MKLAIFSPGFIPVPAIKGGAVEQLTTYLINENERQHKFDIDLYTLDDERLATFNYKYTHLIKISKPAISKIYGLKRNIDIKIFKNDKSSGYVEHKMAALFKSDYYDKVLIENNMDLYLLLLKKKKQEEFYFHLHNDFGPNSGDVTKNLRKTKIIIKTARKILVVSQYLKKKLEKIGAKNVSVVYNGIIGKKFIPVSKSEQISLRKKYEISPNDIVFTFIGRICDDKGIDKLLEAMSLLKNINNIKCLIVGNNFFGSSQDDKYIQKLKQISQPIMEKIKFTGYIPNSQLSKIYSISDCIVIPSQWEEVFGVVALEAMKMEKPVIASNSGALPEVLSHKCSVFVNRGPRYIKELSKAILNLKNDNILRSKMGAAGLLRSKLFPNSEKEYFNEVYKVIK